jgi:hypothetical protein
VLKSVATSSEREARVYGLLLAEDRVWYKSNLTFTTALLSLPEFAASADACVRAGASTTTT